MLKRLFPPKPTPPRGAPGYRAYAIGDIHGHLDLLDRLLADIRADHAARPLAAGVLVILGDLIDRGPDSAGVVERLRTFHDPAFRLVGLTGNHEEVLLRVLDGDEVLLAQWLDFGGTECLASYGLDRDWLETMSPAHRVAAVRTVIPPEHAEFLRGFGDTFSFGDYLFVHAGIRPGLPLDEQSPRDLRWIRQEFLDDTSDHGFVVVHGHTIVELPDVRANRIAIDTGAYRGGPLSALAIDGEERWLMQVGGEKGLH